MSDKEKSEISSAPKSNLVLLLLFVGFIFGFIAGYASKDIIAQSLSKIVKTDIEATQKESSKPNVPAPASEHSVVENAPETTPDNEDESKEEQKTSESEKPSESP